VSLLFGSSHLKATQVYYERYSRINDILRAAPGILAAFHEDAARPLDRVIRKRRARFTSDQLLRAIIVMEVEQLSYRDAAIRIDDSEFLRRFVGIHHGPAMDYSTLAKVYKAVRPQTWEVINRHLAAHAIAQQHIEGRTLRVDTTVCETNVHHPTDSRLLLDGYRTLARLLSKVRALDAEVVGEGKLQRKRVRALVLRIVRRASPNDDAAERVEGLYQALFPRIHRILAWSRQVRARCEAKLAADVYDSNTALRLRTLGSQLKVFESTTARVLDQAQRRVLNGESVPNVEKVLSIFEPHTELIVRGKASKPIEFGHMLLLQQVERQFISGYRVFERRPDDAALIDDILRDHEQLFGAPPESLTADKGFYRSMDSLFELEKTIRNVAIAKKGRRTPEETRREHAPIFKALQRFRAGIEGSISFLKRCFKLARCLYRSFETYCSSVGSHVFAHNLVVLARR
jgi:IS5 family transposase